MKSIFVALGLFSALLFCSFSTINPKAGSKLSPVLNAYIENAKKDFDMAFRQPLTWYLDKESAYAAAKEKGKPVFIGLFLSN